MQAHTHLPIIFCLIAGIYFSAPSFAADIEITDPNDSFHSVFFPGSKTEFNQAFSCEQKYNYQVKTGLCKLHCEFGMCEEQCGWPQIVDAIFQVENCTPESVAIYSSLGHELLATSNDYNKSGNSIALTLIKAISLFYDQIEKIQIDQIGPGPRKGIIENGQMKPLALTTVFISLFPDKSKSESLALQLHVDLSRAGFDQVMCFANNNACEPHQDYFIKRKGLVSAPF